MPAEIGGTLKIKVKYDLKPFEGEVKETTVEIRAATPRPAPTPGGASGATRPAAEHDGKDAGPDAGQAAPIVK